MIEVKFKVKTERRTEFLKQLKLASVPRIGETVIHDKTAYDVIDVQYDISTISEAAISVHLEKNSSLITLEVP